MGRLRRMGWSANYLSASERAFNGDVTGGPIETGGALVEATTGAMMSETVALETRLMVTRVTSVEGSIFTVPPRFSSFHGGDFLVVQRGRGCGRSGRSGESDDGYSILGTC